VRDGNDIASRMTPGSYRFDATRSSIYPPMTLGFPKNTEMEAELTFVRNPGGAGEQERDPDRRARQSGPRPRTRRYPLKRTVQPRENPST